MVHEYVCHYIPNLDTGDSECGVRQATRGTDLEFRVTCKRCLRARKTKGEGHD